LVLGLALADDNFPFTFPHHDNTTSEPTTQSTTQSTTQPPTQTPSPQSAATLNKFEYKKNNETCLIVSLKAHFNQVGYLLSYCIFVF